MIVELEERRKKENSRILLGITRVNPTTPVQEVHYMLFVVWQRLLLRFVRIRKLLFYSPNPNPKPNPNSNLSSNHNINSNPNPKDNSKNKKKLNEQIQNKSSLFVSHSLTSHFLVCCYLPNIIRSLLIATDIG